MARGPEHTGIVPVEEVIKYVANGVLNRVTLQKTNDGRLGAVIPEKGSGRYSLPNAIARRHFFNEGQNDPSLRERRQWNANHRLNPVRR